MLNDKDFLKSQFDLYTELDCLKKNHLNQNRLDYLLCEIEKKIKKYENKIELEIDNKNWKKAVKVISELFFLIKIKKIFTKSNIKDT